MVEITQTILENEIGMSKRTYYRAIEELRQKEYLRENIFYGACAISVTPLECANFVTPQPSANFVTTLPSAISVTSEESANFGTPHETREERIRRLAADTF